MKHLKTFEEKGLDPRYNHITKIPDLIPNEEAERAERVKKIENRKNKKKKKNDNSLSPNEMKELFFNGKIWKNKQKQ